MTKMVWSQGGYIKRRLLYLNASDSCNNRRREFAWRLFETLRVTRKMLAYHYEPPGYGFAKLTIFMNNINLYIAAGWNHKYKR